MLAELGDVCLTVETLRADLGGDQGELERVEERLFAMRALARKHQVLADELPDLAAELTARLDRLDADAGGLGALEAALSAAEAGPLAGG